MSVFHIKKHDLLQEKSSNFSNLRAINTKSPISQISNFSQKESYYVYFSYEILIFLYQFAARVRRNLLLLFDRVQGSIEYISEVDDIR